MALVLAATPTVGVADVPNYELAARRAAQRHGINPDVFVRQLRQESGLRMGVGSPAGARDIAQFIPSTAKTWGVTLGDGRASDDLDGAARLMKHLVGKYGGDYRKALAAYNAGEGAVAKYGGVPPYAETQAYVKKILAGQNPKAAPTRPSSSSAPAKSTVLVPGTKSRYLPAKTDTDGALVDSLLNRKPGQSLLQAAVDRIDSGEYTTPGRTVAGSPEVRLPAAADAPGRTATFKTPPSQSGTAMFEGKKVAAWIAPILQYARAHGWKGTVTSGFRSFADQTRIYNSGVRPAAKPGTSNHEGTKFPRGAIDVSAAEQLARILSNSRYADRLKWAGAKDPVHFSHPHNGSY